MAAARTAAAAGPSASARAARAAAASLTPDGAQKCGGQPGAAPPGRPRARAPPARRRRRAPRRRAARRRRRRRRALPRPAPPAGAQPRRRPRPPASRPRPRTWRAPPAARAPGEREREQEQRRAMQLASRDSSARPAEAVVPAGHILALPNPNPITNECARPVDNAGPARACIARNASSEDAASASYCLAWPAAAAAASCADASSSRSSRTCAGRPLRSRSRDTRARIDLWPRAERCFDAPGSALPGDQHRLTACTRRPHRGRRHAGEAGKPFSLCRPNRANMHSCLGCRACAASAHLAAQVGARALGTALRHTLCAAQRRGARARLHLCARLRSSIASSRAQRRRPWNRTCRGPLHMCTAPPSGHVQAAGYHGHMPISTQWRQAAPSPPRTIPDLTQG